VAGDLRKGLEIAAKDKDSDWVQLMTPEGDALFLRRLGLVNVLRELKGLDWRARLDGHRLVIVWWRGHLSLRLLTAMDGEPSYPAACARTAKGVRLYDAQFPGFSHIRKHNYRACPVVEAL
jgi:hypothetical protein